MPFATVWVRKSPTPAGEAGRSDEVATAGEAVAAGGVATFGEAVAGAGADMNGGALRARTTASEPVAPWDGALFIAALSAVGMGRWGYVPGECARTFHKSTADKTPLRWCRTLQPQYTQNYPQKP